MEINTCSTVSVYISPQIRIRTIGFFYLQNVLYNSLQEIQNSFVVLGVLQFLQFSIYMAQQVAMFLYGSADETFLNRIFLNLSTLVFELK